MQRVSMVSAKVSIRRDNIASEPRLLVGAVREPPTTGAVNAHPSGMALPTPALADDEIAGTAITRGPIRTDTLRLPPTTRADNSHASTVGLRCVAPSDDKIAGVAIIRDANRRDTFFEPPTTHAANRHAQDTATLRFAYAIRQSRLHWDRREC